MADEIKQEEKNTCEKKTASTLIKVVLGLVFLLLGVLAIIIWLPALWTVASGCLGPVLVLAGLVTLAIAKE